MLVLLGVNHQSASIELRERLAFSEADLRDVLPKLVELPGVDEAVVLSTCNRVEVVLHSDDPRAARRAVRDFLATEREISGDELDRHAYHYFDRDVARHLFRVAAGLDSMVLGEPQILGQVKQAFATARDAGTVGSVLDHLMRQVITAAKRVRTETGISRHAVSIAFAAVELARKIFGDLRERTALLLGAGKMGALVAAHLKAAGVSTITVSSRTYQRAARLAEQIGGQAVNWDDAFQQLGKVDIVVSGTAAPGLILEKRAVQPWMRQRRGRPLFLIDIAVPRDIAPDVNDLDGVYLYDVDDLQGVVASNLAERRRAAEDAVAILEEEVAVFDQWVESLKVAPTIAAMRDAVLGIGDREFERYRSRLGPLTDVQEEQFRALIRGVLQKTLHGPIVHLRDAAQRGDGAQVAAMYRRIFGLSVDPKPEPLDDGQDSASTPASARPRAIGEGEG